VKASICKDPLRGFAGAWLWGDEAKVLQALQQAMEK
jgi:hypothetical protein